MINIVFNGGLLRHNKKQCRSREKQETVDDNKEAMIISAHWDYMESF